MLDRETPPSPQDNGYLRDRRSCLIKPFAFEVGVYALGLAKPTLDRAH
jgi:hypothetical protein